MGDYLKMKRELIDTYKASGMDDYAAKQLATINLNAHYGLMAQESWQSSSPPMSKYHRELYSIIDELKVKDTCLNVEIDTTTNINDVIHWADMSIDYLRRSHKSLL